MGMFDRFGGQAPAPAHRPLEPDAGGVSGAASKLVERLLDVGIGGKGQFDSAHTVAEHARAKARGGTEKAIDAVVADHLKLAAAGGFLTGLGGFVTLPVALPANVAGFYILATRMAAATAILRGCDIGRPEVRSAVLLSLVGAESDDLLKKAGFAAPAGRLASLAAERMPSAVVMAINKGVGFRLLTQVGKKTLARFGRGVPLIGGVVGAGLDVYLMKQLADHVRTEFPETAPGGALSAV